MLDHRRPGFGRNSGDKGENSDSAGDDRSESKDVNVGGARRASMSAVDANQCFAQGAGLQSDSARERSKLIIGGHDKIDQFYLKELRVQVFDTYAICCALLTTLSGSRYLLDNKDPDEFIRSGKVHVSFLLHNVHLFIAHVCTAASLESLLVFVLCAMYSRSALARPDVGGKVYDLFVQKTAMERQRAFYFMITSSLLFAFSLVINLSAMPTFFAMREVPAYVLDVCATVTTIILLVLFVIITWQTVTVINAASIVYMPMDLLEAAIQEHDESLPLKEKSDSELGADDSARTSASSTIP